MNKFKIFIIFGIFVFVLLVNGALIYSRDNDNSVPIKIDETADQQPVTVALVGPVSRVIDGDTVVVKPNSFTEEHVRIVGIDAPEKEECYFNEATDRLSELVLNEYVSLERGSDDKRDKYGRLLMYLELSGEDIGALLIQEGLVENYEWFTHPRAEIYEQLEDLAKEGNKGLWEMCKQ
ncbi:thermonuclease family protein [Candidatus Peregrinibacteria bacterium]|jgi:endonuclease YncB( thermonuclease family)|nr:thermonuclease family protein [Candidatus Peregrinibacteria bacterium]MBT3598997.1 thermonuclease family protein [Candidatus Peregrinibacteria bacterium]MBT4366971.1 thermonuclease family protein [Candidatus Peregrinibacteria bacterium]MBT4585562.1 thermonuclease family protein [Candidatus Peregrinibacteria bacterium]MBT6731292.1 thermonuclease family protein [Candidatus Peregrinibacteria bacterium]